MKLEQELKFVEWFKDLILAFETFFHNVQLWLDGTIYPSKWFQNLIAEEETGESEAE